MLKFVLFIIVINIGFIVLVDIMVEVRDFMLKMTWGREKFEAYRQWEKARFHNLRQAQRVSLQNESSGNSSHQSVNVKPESVKPPLISILIVTICMIILQAYLMARFTLFYHVLSGSQFLLLTIIASVISLIIHLSSRHGLFMAFILISSYFVFGAFLYR
ncbi:MAG: hypothetical protein NT096_08955 [Proteobacteria bacterium]|nr:hypothetical protein [Pseudomonadota bacterium]